MNSTRSKHKILLVDDEAIFLNRLIDLCQDNGFEYETAQNGMQAYEILLARPVGYFSAVVSDILMPEMNGVELLKAVKTNPDYKFLPFILQTGFDSEQFVRDSIEMGAYYYLKKPLTPSTAGKILTAAVQQFEEHNLLHAEIKRTQNSFQLIQSGIFHYKSISEARNLASLLSHLSSHPHKAAVGLNELMINAVEHGNLGISYQEKSTLIAARTLSDEIEERLNSTHHQDKFVTVGVDVAASGTTIEIQDMGQGFDFSEYLTFSMNRLTDAHGRGILMASQNCFQSMQYSQAGTRVSCLLI